MSTVNSKLIDKYNWELKPISCLSDINSDYVVLINTNTDGTAGTNKKVKIGLLKNYINLSYTESDVQDSIDDESIQGQINTLKNEINTLKNEINNEINETIKHLTDLTGQLETKVNRLIDDNSTLKLRVETLENLVSLA